MEGEPIAPLRLLLLVAAPVVPAQIVVSVAQVVTFARRGFLRPGRQHRACVAIASSVLALPLTFVLFLTVPSGVGPTVLGSLAAVACGLVTTALALRADRRMLPEWERRVASGKIVVPDEPIPRWFLWVLPLCAAVGAYRACAAGTRVRR